MERMALVEEGNVQDMCERRIPDSSICWRSIIGVHGVCWDYFEGSISRGQHDDDHMTPTTSSEGQDDWKSMSIEDLGIERHVDA